MKRLFSLFCALILIFVVGCSIKTSKLDNETLEAAKTAVEVVDDFLDNRIDEKKAYDRLDKLEDKISDGSEALGIRIYIHALETDLMGFSSTSTTADILEDRNKLAKEIGMKKRKK